MTFSFVLATSVQAQIPVEPDSTLVYGVVNEFGTGETLERISVSLTPVSVVPEDGDLSVQEFRRIRFTRYSTNSNEDGYFELENIDPGDYYLQAERNGYIRPGEVDPLGTLITVPDDTILPLSLELLFGAVIEGQVADDAGEPLSDIQVVAQQWVYGLEGRVLEDVVLPQPVSFRSFGNSRDASVTNQQGVYRLAGLMPGEYQVVARLAPTLEESTREESSPAESRDIESSPQEPSDDESRIVELDEDAAARVWGPVYYPSTDRADQAGRVHIEVGAQVIGINIEWQEVPTIKIRGRIVGDPGASELASLLDRGAVDLSIAETGGESAATLNVSVGPNGEFEILAVSSRPYVLTAEALGANASEDYIGHTDLEVKDEDVDNVLITVHSPIPLSGRIIPVGPPTGGFGFGQLAVDLVDMSGKELLGGQMAVFDDGTFHVDNLALHDYHIRLNGLPPGMYLESGRYGWTDPFMRRFSPGEDPGASLEIRVGTSPGKVTGIAHRQDGESYRNGKIALVPQGVYRDRYDLYRTLSAETDGSFSFDNVPPGSYRVFAWNIGPEPSELMDNYFLLPFETLGTFVQVESAGEVEVDLVIIFR